MKVPRCIDALIEVLSLANPMLFGRAKRMRVLADMIAAHTGAEIPAQQLADVGEELLRQSPVEVELAPQPIELFGGEVAAAEQGVDRIGVDDAEEEEVEGDDEGKGAEGTDELAQDERQPHERQLLTVVAT